jgi:hypothetical protein
MYFTNSLCSVAQALGNNVAMIKEVLATVFMVADLGITLVMLGAQPCRMKELQGLGYFHQYFKVRHRKSGNVW